MQQVSLVINENKDSAINLSEYFKIITVIEDQKIRNPDIAIESCKALIEGVSKKIICFFDKTDTTNRVDDLDFIPLYKELVEKLEKNGAIVESDVILRSFALLQRLGEIRNKRGEISHGKKYPKTEESDKSLSQFIASVTDSLLAYLLQALYSIDLSIEIPISFEENVDFNTYLDSDYQDLGISYSKALYEQDYVRYTQELLEFASEEGA